MNDVDLEGLRDHLKKKGAGEDETLNEQERMAAKREGAVAEDDAELKRIVGDELKRMRDADFRARMHRALDHILDQQARKKTCIGDRGPERVVFNRDDFWDSFLAGRKPS